MIQTNSLSKINNNEKILYVGGTEPYNYTKRQDDTIFGHTVKGSADKIINPLVPRVYFVIGIGTYIEGGTWPMYDNIFPILLFRFGKLIGPHILTPFWEESINFREGDIFLGYYPFLNPGRIGFVCGIWIDV